VQKPKEGKRGRCTEKVRRRTVCAKEDDEYLRARAGCIRLYWNVCYVAVRVERKKMDERLGESFGGCLYLARTVR
jgi:hypothetical protein